MKYGVVVAAATAAAMMIMPAYADDTLRVGTPEASGYSYSPLAVGIETGIFKKYHLDVERLDFAGGAKLAQAMASGAIDVSLGSGSDLSFVIRGAPERGVAAFGNDLNEISVMVRSDDPAKNFDDLRGKTIGVTTSGSFTSWVAQRIAANRNWGPDDIKLAYLGQTSSLVAGLLAKNVDAIVGSTAQGLIAQKDGRLRILVKAGDEITDFIAEVIFASESMMKERPDELRRFLRAWFETIKFIKGNKAETIRIARNVTKLPDDIATALYDSATPLFFTDGHFDAKKLAAVQQALVDVKQIEKPVPRDQIVTEAFLQ